MSARKLFQLIDSCPVVMKSKIHADENINRVCIDNGNKSKRSKRNMIKVAINALGEF